MPLPTYTEEQAGDYIANGHWLTGSGTTYSYLSFDASAGDTLLVYFGSLSDGEVALATAALEAWSTVTGITFQETTNYAISRIDFTNSGFSASAGPAGFNPATGEIAYSEVNIGAAWTSYYGGELGDYSFQTYLHEIGHALGLGHAGPYDGGAVFDDDAIYANDSWQMSIMSYFSPDENPYVFGDEAYVVTPMIADIEAMEILYGLNPDVHVGDTVWGANSNIGGYLQDIFDDFAAGTLTYDIALTVHDTDGIDTIDLSTVSAAQTIDLREAAISSVGGVDGNMVIANGTVIENVVGGSGKDTITGNDVANTLNGQDGNDTISGLLGNDTINGGKGKDKLNGGGGNDNINGGNGVDVINGGNGNDTGSGGAGNDKLNGGGGADTLNGGGGADTLNGGGGADTLNGGAGADKLNGGGGADTSNGGAGTDTINGGGGTDTINGGAGNDDLTGGNGNDTINGGSGGDDLTGGNGSDTINGGGGGDTLNGGGGNDDLTGGVGADEFIFNTNFGTDVITDFNTSVDSLVLNDAIWGDDLDAAEVVEIYGGIVDGNAELDFGDSGFMTLNGVTSLDDLESTITIV